MKKVFLLVMLVAGILFGAEAQNRSINFEQTKVWKQIVKKAKKEKKLIFVDCYTSWCGPCKMLAPTVDKLAEKYDGKVIVGKVDVDEEQELARQFGVMSIPTVVLFKDGKEVQRTVGVQPQAAFERLVDDIL